MKDVREFCSLKKTIARMIVLIAIFFGIEAIVSYAAEEPETLTDKTLVVWASPETVDQSGGAALSIDMANPDAFDAIVFGEITDSVWMPGSTNYRRTNQAQIDWPKETITPGEWTRLTVVYRGKTVEFYRNDVQIASYEMDGEPQIFDDSATILFGPRHMANQDDSFIGRILDARIYPTALSAEKIQTLEPGKITENLIPWAWWDFAKTGLYEKCGRFNQLTLKGDVRLENGSLNFGEEKGAFFARKSSRQKIDAAVPDRWDIGSNVPESAIESARILREKFLADPFRPRWHFTPPEDNGTPGDPNGCFYANGLYHLMYLYHRTGSGFCWGHLSSSDLVHWRHHPDSIGPGDGDDGCFSGGAFLDSDQTAYLTYWMLNGALGIGMAKSDPPYNKWKKLPENPVISSTEFGITEIETPNGKTIYGSADPSNIWKKDNKYYMLTGNLLVLNKYGRTENASAEQKGDRLYLFESENLTDWNYKGIFYQRSDRWTDGSEDNMCPVFLPLPSSPEGGEPSGKHLLLFISHNKGCQYYIGSYDTANDRFLPETHGRMTWVDNTYFAPEAFIDDRGRVIMWAWLLDNRENEIASGWSGVYGLPRTLWLAADGTLQMRPVPEIEKLRLNEQHSENIAISSEKPAVLDGVVGDSCEIEIYVHPNELAKAKKFGVTVREDTQTGEKTVLYYDTITNELVFDATQSGQQGRPIREAAPLDINEGEPLELRVFIDQCVVEIYANNQQAICRRVYPSQPNCAQRISLFSEGEPLSVQNVRTWEITPSNPY